MNNGISSRLEGYATAFQEQEIGTRVTIKRRVEDQQLPTKCRLLSVEERMMLRLNGYSL